MNSVILKWNPAISSYSMQHYLTDIMNLNRIGYHEMNWSVWDYEKIHKDDRFYLLKVGQYGQTGIIAFGFISSNPYTGSDWRGKKQIIHYVNLDPYVMLNPDALPILSTERVQAEMPDFDVTGGHSGVVLTDSYAEKLNLLWWDFYNENRTTLFEQAMNCHTGDDGMIYSELSTY